MRAEALFAAALLLPGAASAAGFAVGEQGAASLGIASAATARLDLPEAAFFNPAALPRKEGLHLAAGVALVAPALAHTDPASGTVTSSLSALETPPALHLAWARSDLAARLYVGVPFGASLSW